MFLNMPNPLYDDISISCSQNLGYTNQNVGFFYSRRDLTRVCPANTELIVSALSLICQHLNVFQQRFWCYFKKLRPPDSSAFYSYFLHSLEFACELLARDLQAVIWNPECQVSTVSAAEHRAGQGVPHSITEWFGLGEALKLILFHTPAMGRVTFH